jgi:hypothetical protein
MRALFHMNYRLLFQNVYHSNFVTHWLSILSLHKSQDYSTNCSAKPSWLHSTIYFIYNELILYCSLSSSLCVMFRAICSECTSRASAQFREAHRSTNTPPGVLFWDKVRSQTRAGKGDGHKHACTLGLSCLHPFLKIPCKHFKQLSCDNAKQRTSSDFRVTEFHLFGICKDCKLFILRSSLALPREGI